MGFICPRGFPHDEEGETLGDVLTNLSTSTLMEASDRNCIEFFQHYGLGPGCEIHEDPDLVWFVTGIPHPLFNGVMHTELEPGEVPERIDGMVSEFRRRGLPLEWTTSLRTRPLDLGRRLEAKGFEHTLDVPAMTLDLRSLPEVQVPGNLTVAPAQTREDLRRCLDIALSTFGIPTDFVPRLLEIEEGMPSEQRELTRHYLARVDGRPAATAELYHAAGVAGLYFVGTLPEARDRGIARAVTVAALHDAREMGVRVGTLQATPMGAPVYRKLGFRELFPMGIYMAP